MLKRFCSVVAVVLFAASPAGALTISGLTISLGGTTSPDDISTSHTNNTSATSVLSSGGTVADAPLATVSAATRYASNLWSDAGLFDPSENVITTNSYDLSMSVSADPGTIYDITIDSLFRGILNRVDDGFFDQSSAGVSAATTGTVVTASVCVLLFDFCAATRPGFLPFRLRIHLHLEGGSSGDVGLMASVHPYLESLAQMPQCVPPWDA